MGKNPGFPAEKTKTASTPSQRRNEKQASESEFKDEITKSAFFLHICNILGFSIPPVWVSRMGSVGCRELFRSTVDTGGSQKD